MAQLMLVNPRKRRRKAKATTKRRTVARRRTTHKRRRTYARNPIALNPSRRAKRTHRRKYRRNPIGMGRGKMKGLLAPLMPAAISATGAIGLDLAWGIIGSKLPANLGTGPIRHVAKAAGALALGALAGMIVKKDTANQLTIGALTVVLHSAMKETIQKTMPNVQLGESESGYMNGLAEYFTEPSMAGMGEYFTEPAMNGVGYSGGGEYFYNELEGMGENEFSL